MAHQSLSPGPSAFLPFSCLESEPRQAAPGAFRQKPVTAPDLPVPVCEAQGKGVDLSEVPSALGDPSSGDATVTSLEWTVTTSETSFGQAWTCCIGR